MNEKLTKLIKYIYDYDMKEIEVKYIPKLFYSQFSSNKDKTEIFYNVLTGIIKYERYNINYHNGDPYSYDSGIIEDKIITEEIEQYLLAMYTQLAKSKALQIANKKITDNLIKQELISEDLGFIYEGN